MPLAVNWLTEDLNYIMAHTQGLWEPLRGQNIFVTGGTGFFGRWLLESFAHANRELDLQARMVVLSRDPAAFAEKARHLSENPAIKLVRGDIRTFSAAEVRAQLEPSFSGHYEFVIHAATEASAKLNAENPLLMLDTIVQGTRTALEFAVATGAKRFLLTSSGAVYGRQPSDLTHLPEDYLGGPDCTNPASAYGEGKRMAELLCACFHQQHGLETLIARCFAFVGPFLPLDTHFAIGNFIRDALAGGPIQVKGDGTPYRSYLYAADLAIWLWTILLKGIPLRGYNVGSENVRTITEVAQAVREASGMQLDISIAQSVNAMLKPTSYVPETTWAKQELRLAESIAISDGIARTMQWHSRRDEEHY